MIYAEFRPIPTVNDKALAFLDVKKTIFYKIQDGRRISNKEGSKKNVLVKICFLKYQRIYMLNFNTLELKLDFRIIFQ